MGDLDEKLRGILLTCMVWREHIGAIKGESNSKDRRDDRDDGAKRVIEAIKQAFKDEESRKVQLRVKTRLWTPKGFDEFDRTWTPQVLVPRNRLHIALDARDTSFVEVTLLNEGDDLMTGEEWKKRFEKELDEILDPDLETVITVDDYICPDTVLLAARRASGLEKD